MKHPKNYRFSKLTLMRLEEIKSISTFRDWTETEIVEYAIEKLEDLVVPVIDEVDE